MPDKASPTLAFAGIPTKAGPTVAFARNRDKFEDRGRWRKVSGDHTFGRQTFEVGAEPAGSPA
jgi:hypothetical protein